MSSPKRNRILPHRNRQHILRPVPQPKSGQCPQRPQVQTGATPSPPSPSDDVVRRATKPFLFLDLPGEIRNKIYDLVVPAATVIISGNHPQKELKKLKAQQPLKKHKASRHRLFGEVTVNAVPIALLLTCRQMHHEAVKFIYGRTTFCFNRIVTIRKFLNNAPAAGLESIESLAITHTGYAEPRWLADREWKLRHERKWSMTLERIKAQMSALQRLNLRITFFDWPCRLDLDERWARPLLDLAGGGLDWVNVTLDHDRFHPVKNEATAKELENRMMTAEGRRKKAVEEKLQAQLEKKRQEESQRKANKILTIVIPVGEKSSSNAPFKKVVKSTGLEQYAMRGPPVAYC